MARETYFEMIRYARSKHIWVRTTTNASLLHLQENYKKLIDSGVNEVQISIDGASKETFEKIRRGSRFERVIENCKLINGYCAQRNLLRTRMWIVVQKDNVHEFLDFVDLGHTLGFRRLSYALNLTDWAQQKWTGPIQEMTVEDSVSPGLAQKGIKRGTELDLDVSFWNITAKYSTKTPEHLCPWPFERAYISSDMKIVPCCMIANPDVLQLGDAHDLTGNWNGQRMMSFRKMHLQGKIPKLCQSCYVSDSTGK